MKWLIHDDGSFDLASGDLCITGAYPALDGVPFRPTGLAIEHDDDGGGQITYRAHDRTLTLRLRAVSANEVTIDATLAAAPGSAMPRSVAPLALGALRGVRRIFRQAQGIAGGTGFVDLPTGGKAIWSHAITALVDSSTSAGGGLVITTPDHGRFEHLCNVGALPGDGSTVRLSAQFSTERIPVPGSGSVQLPTLRITRASRLEAGLRDAAEIIARHMCARDVHPTSYHWCSWYYLYHNLDMPRLREYLQGLGALSPRSPMRFVQIDAGYFPSAGDWLRPNHHFPDGLKPAFDAIRDAGYTPGVWVGPFMVGNRSALYRDHPDWVLRDADDRPVTGWRHYGEPKVWGYPDEETYVLDTSHPAAMDYLRDVFGTLRRMGAGMFKTDFLYWGYQDSTQVRRHAPGKTSVQYFRDAMSTIREAIGADSFWLGCIAPYMPCVGFMDAMRIGGDVGASWRGSFGPQSMLNETANSQHFNNVFWQNDPDAVMLRDFHIELTPTEVRGLGLWQAAMGGSVNTSDPLHRIASDRLSLWRQLEPPPGRHTARLPLFGQPGKPLVAVRDYAVDVLAVLVFNPTEDALQQDLALGALEIDAPVPAVECDPAGPTAPTRDLGTVSRLPTTGLAPHGSGLYYVGRGALPTATPPARVFG